MSFYPVAPVPIPFPQGYTQPPVPLAYGPPGGFLTPPAGYQTASPMLWPAGVPLPVPNRPYTGMVADTGTPAQSGWWGTPRQLAGLGGFSDSIPWWGWAAIGAAIGAGGCFWMKR